MESDYRIVKYAIPIFVLSIIFGTMFLSEQFEVFGDKEDKEKIKENKNNENKIKPLRGQLALGSETSVKKLQEHGFTEVNKIHPKILEIVIDDNPKEKAKQHGAKFDDNKLDAYVYLKQEYINNPPKNIKVLAKSENIVLSQLTIDEIQQLSSSESVERIDLPIKAKFLGHGKSEGVALSMADDLHAVGFTGNNIVVAIIDSGFDVANPEISGNILTTVPGPTCGGDILCGDTPNESHGTAVAEIVVDMAPDVDLILYSINELVGFNNAINDAISKNADIITASVGFPTIGGDGVTGFYRDGTSSAAKKVDDANNSGILFTAAVGNQGESHWQGNYVPSPVDPSTIPMLNALGPFQSVMDFNPTAMGSMRACLPVTDTGDFYYASWNAWATTNQDYDLLLYSSDMSTFLAGSFSNQAGMTPLAPMEFFSWLNVGNACLVLASFSSTQNHFFHINTESNAINDPSFIIRSGSIDTPGDAAGAISVGAINHFDDQLEDFSSSGPTDDGRLKPEICGPDRTLTHQTQLNPPLPGIFPGTSAATPHVAGAAALLLDVNPSLTVSELKDLLISSARFNASYSIDNLCGFTSPMDPTKRSGALQLPQVFMVSQSDLISILDSSQVTKIGAPSPPCVVPPSGDWIILSNCTLVSSAVVTGNVIVQNNSVLTIPSGVTLDIDFLNKHLMVKFGSGVKIKVGGKIT